MKLWKGAMPYQVLFADEEALKVRICVDKVSRELGWAGITGWGFIFIFLLYPPPSFMDHSHHHLISSQQLCISHRIFTHHPLPSKIIIISSSDYFICSCLLLFPYHQHVSSLSNLFLLLQVGTQHDQIVNVWDWKNNIKVMEPDDNDDGGWLW